MSEFEMDKAQMMKFLRLSQNLVQKKCNHEDFAPKLEIDLD